jgi:hypothetical protein
MSANIYATLTEQLEKLRQEAEDDVFIPCIGIFGPHTHQYYLGAPKDDAEKCESAQNVKMERIKKRQEEIRSLAIRLHELSSGKEAA